KPVARLKEFDSRVLGLIHSLKSFELLTCEAAVEGNYKKALLAMTINPLVHSDEDAKVVLDEMLEAHKKYLPQFNNK
ncbi:MAG: 6-phospho-beta-glucosidase, partial [Erysipelotrichaceae bacterium]